MKKVLLALCVLMLVAGSASAWTLSQGDVWMHLTGGSTMWTTEYGTLAPRAPAHWDQTNLPPGFVPDGIQVGDISRTVINMDSFQYVGPGDVNLPDGDLTGLVYDLVVSSIATRMGGVGNTQLIYDITFSNPDQGVAMFELYRDYTPEGVDDLHVFDPNGDGMAPLQWAADNTYLNINDAGDDATLWLQAQALEVVSGTGIVSMLSLNTVTGTAETEGLYLEITGGSEAHMFDTGIGTIATTGVAYDLFSDYTAYNPASSMYYTLPASEGGWQMSIDDPIHGSVIPEPATLTLLGLGIAGLFARKRKKQ